MGPSPPLLRGQTRYFGAVRLPYMLECILPGTFYCVQLACLDGPCLLELEGSECRTIAELLVIAEYLEPSPYSCIKNASASEPND